MKKDIWEEFSLMAEDSFLKGSELESIKGGWSLDDIIIHLPINGKCSTHNTCDPINCGACAGNTTGGAPRTCPMSE